jgi:hypothetical protein
MRHIAIAMIYIAFFGTIAVAVWLTGSAQPLWAMLLAPAMRTTEE